MIRMKLYERANEQVEVDVLDDSCSIYVAYIDNVLAGYCVFRLEEDSFVTLVELNTSPQDLSLADGLARAAIASASYRMKTKVRVEVGNELDSFIDSTATFCDREALIEVILGSTECKGIQEG